MITATAKFGNIPQKVEKCRAIGVKFPPMPERNKTRYIEGREVKFVEPVNTEIIRLPKVVEVEETWSGNEKKDILLGMHTDMLGAMVRAIASFSDKTREGLYIQGRVMTASQAEAFYDSPVWSFFWKGRAYRMKDYAQQYVSRYIFPKDSKLTEEEVRTYEKMTLNPETTRKKFKHKVGWYNAESIMDSPRFQQYSQNTLTSILGACNEFKVGSDVLSPRILQLVRGRFIEYFRSEHMIVKLDKRWLEETKLELVSRIFRI